MVDKIYQKAAVEMIYFEDKDIITTSPNIPEIPDGDRFDYRSRKDEKNPSRLR